ncbi:HAD family phosphatase [Gordonia sp. (in: high G+C Gram-positive bacteria)]|uniref:HAD family hydrolase n=1 Tax=Gordonia sp. (in: high G+C Gram-positive bacteria) TaxID=84139 RepID=UPI001DC82DB8|nr:beta-phosphoglucomutase family hydrolase [Gordonia sp. (in: high G+C Gram-positive bacteria)]MCB1296439.1 beta-phosphoglucomutase family hydrolase [Gordonia sp. (in: high G+C Gram-positive bacteria)]HMS76595.1 beta-phosphoglucomutase family hydrolase [Gordonia sp. (in: high G+C Gram-positive bacteria)]HQV20398.1 beta-phosphoglucomutase family hydrolase [Gordonia sp. (in: high G+C Gram-positive bacteria)]
MLGLPETVTVALFDLDGVLTSTAVLHRSAWKRAFDAYLRERDPDGFAEFTAQDYLDYVDGRPRTDGVRTFLASRGITADEATVEEIGTGKNEMFVAALASEGVTPYPGSVRYLEAAREAGLRIAVVTSSKNGEAVLEAADLTKYVEIRVDGLDVAARGLNGKPAPDSFLLGAELMGVPPAHAAVFEDAISGVTAAAAGDFGYVVAIDRHDGEQTDAMRAAGASIVVADLDELVPA